MTHEDVRLVEAILFATSSAISVSQIAERFPAERKALIPVILEQLQAQFANRGINLVQRDNRWALRTATDLGDRLRLEKEQPKKFTRSAMETMAIVAYHQPVTRAEIENIRGVATSPGALDALMEAGWIKPGKRREVPGRPVTWLSTQAFLDHFGLEKLEDLPGMEELKAAGLLDKRPAVEAMPTADLFEENDKHEHDPQEVTDEDLVGKVTEEGGDITDLDTVASADDASEDEESEEEDFDDEESDDEDSDGDEDEDEEDDEEESDSEEDDSDDYEEEDDEDSDDEDDEDSDDEDYDDEDYDDEDDEDESDEDDEEDDEDEDDEDDK
ncbi:MAG: SMC-Scp complex subunit ScpB [Alphaproteobacteria bacterium]|nr:SMC-Scp complex subunit ScpB [Alphaproteobacteria bacterium]